MSQSNPNPTGIYKVPATKGTVPGAGDKKAKQITVSRSQRASTLLGVRDVGWGWEIQQRADIDTYVHNTLKERTLTMGRTRKVCAGSGGAKP